MTKRPYAEFDIECYPDWFLIKFYAGAEMYSFPMVQGGALDIAGIQWFIDRFTLVGFNSDNYDIPMLSLAMCGMDCRQLREANNHIIIGGLKRWDFYKTYGVEQPFNLDHVDIMEVAPGVRVGLKAYMGRMHSDKLQDLPYDSDLPTTPDMRVHLDTYCGNDLIGTRQLRETCAERLELREEMGAQYGVDLRSKSDAQMAEAIIKSQLGFKPEKRYVPHGFQFQYQPPAFVSFATPQMRQVFDVVKAAWFSVNDTDQVRALSGIAEGEDIIGDDGKKIKTGLILPPELKAMLVRCGNSAYQFGIGGLHSTESSLHHHTIMGRWTVSDHDVNSYYPSLILLCAMYPQQLGPIFLDIYGREYADRLKAKADATDPQYLAELQRKFKTRADGKKIVLNGAFGKLGSKYSILFAPELLIQVTITGQLCILMLIEMLELCGISVLSANTDGIVLKTPVGREWLRDSCIAHWEKVTGLTTEATFYRSIYSRDVNNYLAFKHDGKAKGKGAFAESGVINNVHPERDICADAAIAYLGKGTPVEKTIRECTDIRKFLTIRNVKGGGVYYPTSLGLREQVIDAEGAVYLGKVVRWYYVAGETQAIHYKTIREPKASKKTGITPPRPTRGAMVAGTEGARPCMQLPKVFPDDIDYKRYEDETVKLLGTVGVQYPF